MAYDKEKVAKQKKGFNEVKSIPRNEIKEADYNPRIIDEDNLKKLTKDIREHGLVTPLVWNKRTGVLVSGHQRLAAMDKIHRKKDYEVPVAVIDVDEKEEKQLNVQMNNPSLQGSWDLGALAELRDDGISFEDMGFDKGDIDFMYDGEVDFDDGDLGDVSADDDDNGDHQQQSPVSKRGTPFDEEVEDEKDKLADMSKFTGEEGLEKFNEKKANFRHKDQDTTIINFYTKVVFPSNEAKKDFYKKASIPANEEYITFDQLKRYFERGDD